MTKEQLIALGLTAEQADKVLEGYKDHIPKDRFDQVNNAKKEAEKQLTERDKQLETLKKGVTDNEALTKQITDLQAENLRIKEETDKQIKQIEMDYLLDATLKTDFKAKDVKSVLAHLDKTKITVDNGKLIGLKEQVEPLSKEKDFLFEAVKQEQKQNFTGLKPGETNTAGQGQQQTGGGLKAGLAGFFAKQQNTN